MLVVDPNDPSPTIERDMLSSSSFSVSDPYIDRLYIVYERENSNKVIADISNKGKLKEIQEDSDPTVERTKEGIRNSNESNQLIQMN